jgi:DNA polymerase III gamma/tau subunit
VDLQVKYRPETLEEFCGHISIVKAIQEDFKNGQLKHNIMLIGESGVGKTTLAYIIAKSLLKVHTASIKEINAADARGIDDVRDIIKDVSTRPLIGENKVYIIDEAHQLTKDAQNALLKPLESPKNAHVYWLFCTTNPNSIIKTIKNRCTQYALGSLSVSEVLDVLRPILKEEDIKLPEAILKIIVSKASGIPREAVKLLDQFRNVTDKEEIDKIVREFGVKYDEFEKMGAFLKQPWSKIGPKLQELFKRKAPESVRIGLLAYYSVCLQNSNNPQEMEKFYQAMEILSTPIIYNPQLPQGVLVMYKLNKLLKG